MFRVLEVGPEGTVKVSEGDALVGPPPEGVVRWIDLEKQDNEALGVLGERFQFHPLTIEDCLHFDQRPKMEEYGDYLFLVTHGFRLCDSPTEPLVTLELHSFLGERYLVTVHAEPIPPLEAVWKRLTHEPALVKRGADFISYLVCDAIVDSFFPLVDDIEDQVEQVEDHVLSGRPGVGEVGGGRTGRGGREERVRSEECGVMNGGGGRDERVRSDEGGVMNGGGGREMGRGGKVVELTDIFRLKRLLVQLRKVLSPQRDVFALLAKRGEGWVDQRTAVYFRDVYDHVLRIHEWVEGTRDLLGNALDAYLWSASQRTNEIMKRLTLLSAIFMPLTVITGFWGQNFTHLPFDSTAAEMGTLAACVVVPATMVWFFMRSRWF